MNYQETFGSFPPGRIPSFDPRDRGPNYPCTSKNVDRSPLLFILPYLEDSIVYDGHNQVLASYAPENRTAFTRPPSSYHCPSDTGAVIRSVIYLRFPIPPTQPIVHAYDVGRTSYLANFGTLNTNAIPSLGINCKPDPTALAQQDGIFNDLHPIASAHVIDGLGKTVLFAERTTAILDQDQSLSGDDARYAWWFVGNVGDSLGTGAIRPNSRGGSALRRAQTVSSGHAGGIHVVFGDGSARFISDAVESWPDDGGMGPIGASFNGIAWTNVPSPRIWQAMWSRAGNENSDSQ